MQRIDTAMAGAAERAATIAERINEMTREQRMARGVAAYGWPADASCDRCGDTGELPMSRTYCECAAGGRKRAVDAEARLTAEWERRWLATGVPKRFRGYRLETSPLNTPADRHLVELARGWAAGDPVASGRNLVISGGVGCGKTGFAIGALYELHAAGVGRLHYTSTSALIDALKPGGEEGVLTTAQRAECLALDDLGTTRGTDWEQDRLYALLNARYEEQVPTIITTNVALPDLAASVGERIVSRLVEGCVVIALGGIDRRR